LVAATCSFADNVNGGKRFLMRLKGNLFHFSKTKFVETGFVKIKEYTQTRMWANAQRDGRPAEYSGALCSMPQSLADVHY